jgi:sugar lactone lactonase YvrE
MKAFSFGTYALSAGVAVALLAGCGGSQPPIGAPGAMPQSVMDSSQYAHSGPLLYVSNDGDYHDVKVYAADAKDPSPIETISDDLQFPSGICLDGQGTLYVTDQDGWVAEYPPGKTKPSKIITKGINNPAFCAIDSTGNLWVTNLFGPNVTEYLKGSTKPHTVITKGLVYPVGIAIDHSGNMYVSNGSYGPTYNVVVYSPGSKSPSRTITNGVTAPVGIAVDAKGTLYVANYGTCNVEEYLSGQEQPYQEITDEINGPSGLTVGKNGWLYVSNTGYQSCNSDHPWNLILEFPPGSITPSAREISKGLYLPWGTAYSPPLRP